MNINRLRELLEPLDGDREVFLIMPEDAPDDEDLTHIFSGEWAGVPYVALGSAKTEARDHEIKIA